jgi:MtN3 and saliva related transmembrane protein
MPGKIVGMSTSQLLGSAATAYGVIAALTVLLQARQMHVRGASCEISARFFASYVGGYAVWLLYGFSVGSIPLIAVDAVGLLCGGLTLAVALSLRGSLLRPSSWSCDATQVSVEVPARVLLQN